MNKIKTTIQLVIVYFIVIISSFSIFIGLTHNRIKASNEILTLNSLSTYIDLVGKDWKSGSEISVDLPEDVYYITGSISFQMSEVKPEEQPRRPEPIIIDYSDNLADIDLNRDALLESIMTSIHLTPNSKGNTQCEVRGRELYVGYSVSNMENNTCYYILLFSDKEVTAANAVTLSEQIILVFTLTSAISFLLLIVWARYHVRRIKRLEHHISLLPLSNYKDSYIDNGKDELAHLANAIEKMRIEIYENDKTKQEILQNVSHDLKTPIGVIKSYAEAMQDNHMVDKGPEIIARQADILYNKTAQLITYNKLEYLTHDKEFENVNMRRLIESVVSNFEAKNPNIKFELNLEDIYYKGYSDNFVTVIENILDNATRYAKTLIRINLNENNLVIYNDGEHIEQKFIDKGFKAYEKGSNGKFGLGMSIVTKTLLYFDMVVEVINEDKGVSFIIHKK